MRKPFIYIIISIVLILVIGIFFAFFWKGEHLNYSNGVVGFSQKNDNILVKTNVFYPGYIYSGYDYKVQEGQIIFWLYKKMRFTGDQTSLTNILIPQISKGNYKIYYKNKDGQLTYIQDLTIN